jgi:hypothetical protein
LRNTNYKEKHIEKVFKLIKEYNWKKAQKTISLIIDLIIWDTSKDEVKIVEFNSSNIITVLLTKRHKHRAFINILILFYLLSFLYLIFSRWKYLIFLLHLTSSQALNINRLLIIFEASLYTILFNLAWLILLKSLSWIQSRRLLASSW